MLRGVLLRERMERDDIIRGVGEMWSGGMRRGWVWIGGLFDRVMESGWVEGCICFLV